MMLALAALLLAILVVWKASSRKARAEPERDITAPVEAWVRETLEHELATGVLGLHRSTPDERRELARTLAHEPDAEVVAAIESKVRVVELAWVRYGHETDVEVTLHVRYEDGSSGGATRRFPEADVPESVLVDFTSKGGTRVFRAWSFPGQRASFL